MKSSFIKIATKTSGLLFALLVLAAWGTTLPNQGRMEYVHELIDHARDGNPFGAGEADGYYEALMQNSDDQSKQKTLIELILLSKSDRSKAQWSDIYAAQNFLIFTAKPNLDLPNTVEGPIKTNSYGLFDHEHTIDKSSATRRVAIFGDSITMGFGLNQQQRFSNLLEDRLNTHGSHHFEFINFAVPGYFLTQTFDDVMNKGPIFHPDVYVLVISDRTVGLLWGNHLVRLVHDGKSLKYDFLQTVVNKSGVQKSDSNELCTWKLAPYRKSAVREMLLRMNTHAQQHSAQFIVALIPSAQSQPALNASFRFIHESLEGTGIITVDLSDAFQNTDFEQFRNNWFDQHPNAEGNRKIASMFYANIHQDPLAWAAFSGAPALLTGTSRETLSSGQ